MSKRTQNPRIQVRETPLQPSCIQAVMRITARVSFGRIVYRWTLALAIEAFDFMLRGHGSSVPYPAFT